MCAVFAMRMLAMRVSYIVVAFVLWMSVIVSVVVVLQ